MNFKSITNNIESLPPLSDVILEIQKCYNDDISNMNIDVLVNLIESDAILTANILKITNSPSYGFSKKISSISQAVKLFGVLQIYGIIVSHVVDESIKANTKVYGLSNERFNDMCHIQSVLIMKWYSKIDFKKAQFLSSLALIMESGKLILAQEIANSSYELEFRQGLHNCEDIEVYEKNLVSLSSYNISALLFEHWNLEPLYIKILLSSKEEQDREILEFVKILDVVKTAINVKEFLTKDSVLKASKLLREMNIDIEPFVAVSIEIKKSYITMMQKKQQIKK